MRWYRRCLAMPEPARPWLRSYTIRRHPADRQQVGVGVVLHTESGAAGPAWRWASATRVGDVIGMYGPAQSHYGVPGEHAWRLVVGDETALPAIGATLELLPGNDRVIVYAEV